MTSGHAIREAKAHSDTFKKLFTDILLLSVSFRKNTDNVHWFTSQLTDMQEWSISDVSSLMNWERSGVILHTKSKYYIIHIIVNYANKKNKSSFDVKYFVGSKTLC